MREKQIGFFARGLSLWVFLRMAGDLAVSVSFLSHSPPSLRFSWVYRMCRFPRIG